MFPEHVTLVLQQLSYLSLVIIAPCTLYNTMTNLGLSMTIKNHIELDDMRFRETNNHLGTHDSQIDDLRMNSANGMIQHFKSIIDADRK